MPPKEDKKKFDKRLGRPESDPESDSDKEDDYNEMIKRRIEEAVALNKARQEEEEQKTATMTYWEKVDYDRAKQKEIEKKAAEKRASESDALKKWAREFNSYGKGGRNLQTRQQDLEAKRKEIEKEARQRRIWQDSQLAAKEEGRRGLEGAVHYPGDSSDDDSKQPEIWRFDGRMLPQSLHDADLGAASAAVASAPTAAMSANSGAFSAATAAPVYLGAVSAGSDSMSRSLEGGIKPSPWAYRPPGYKGRKVEKPKPLGRDPFWGDKEVGGGGKSA